MATLISGAVQFPTVVFTVLLGVVVVYWAFVFLGALDIDVFHVDADVGIDAGVDADLELGHEVGHAAHEGLGGLIGLLQALDLTSVPLTVMLSLWVLSSWTLTYLAAVTLGPAAASLALGSGIAAAAAAVSLAATAIGIVPLKGLFRSVGAQDKRDLVGCTCRVSTLRVNEDYGQAEIDDGAAGIVIQVRCSDPEALAKGSCALVFRYDEADDVYFVKPVTPVDDDL